MIKDVQQMILGQMTIYCTARDIALLAKAYRDLAETDYDAIYEHQMKMMLATQQPQAQMDFKEQD